MIVTAPFVYKTWKKPKKNQGKHQFGQEASGPQTKRSRLRFARTSPFLVVLGPFCLFASLRRIKTAESPNTTSLTTQLNRAEPMPAAQDGPFWQSAAVSLFPADARS